MSSMAKWGIWTWIPLFSNLILQPMDHTSPCTHILEQIFVKMTVSPLNSNLWDLTVIPYWWGETLPMSLEVQSFLLIHVCQKGDAPCHRRAWPAMVNPGSNNFLDLGSLSFSFLLPHHVSPPWLCDHNKSAHPGSKRKRIWQNDS